MGKSRENSLLRLVDNYTVIDIETTGHSLYYDYIIELSAARYRDNKLVDSFSSLVNCGIELNTFIVELTGIEDSMLKKAPNIEEVIGVFLDFVGDDFILGHNVSFDINFINREALKYEKRVLENYYIDTLRLSRRLLKEIENHKLSTLSNHFGIVRIQHRGLIDCDVTNRVYQNLRNLIPLEEIDANGDLVQVKRPTRFRTYSTDLSTVKPTVDIEEIQNYIDDYFFDKNVVITGKLSHFTKIELGQIIVNQGGYFSDSINKNTNVLILGNEDYQTTVYKGKSSKQVKAEKMILEGFDIQIIDEYTAYDLLGIKTFHQK